MSLVVGWGILAATQTWAFCVPIAYGWDPTIPGGHCANRNAGYLVVGIVDAITDFLILCLPLPMILRLKVSRSRQISLMIIFGIAIFTTIVSALRAYSTTLTTADDFTDSRTLLDVLSAIEPAVSILVASSFVLAPVLEKVFPQGFGKKSRFRRMPEAREDNFHRDMELPATKTVVQGPDDLSLGSHMPPAAELGRVPPSLDQIAVEHSVVVQWDGERC
ncbi:MAG: hypothetical protein Q9224_005085 [Gallowayella concinna]